ncbi:hypothetical protein, partial [Bradyrhizobium sp. BRP22]|uniref:hypothetical protein n=1 Tax=Bradyrhizobium sp. BRP22 TaxID=2793821 RepID=UPI00201BEDF2
SPLTSSQNADSITASAGAGCSRSSEFGAHDRAKSLLTISEICTVPANAAKRRRTRRRAGAQVLRAETVRQMTQNATGDLPTLRGPGRGFTLGLGIVIDPAPAKSRPAATGGAASMARTFGSIRKTASPA